MQDILNTMQLFNKIKNTASNNDKLCIIKQNQNDKVFMECLKFLVDTNVVTGIATKKYESCSTLADAIEFSSQNLLALMNYIKDNNTGRDVDIAKVKSLIRHKELNSEAKQFIKELFTKKIKLGVSVKTVNKAIPNCIYVYETQQAYPISDKNTPKIGEWFSLSEKINGTNCGILDGKCISRQGKPFNNLGHIVDEINKLGLGDKYVNGELVRWNEDGIPDDENFQRSVSIINSDAENKTEIHLIFYEVLTKEEFFAGKSNKKYKERLKSYFPIQDKIKLLGLKYIHFVNHFYEGTNQDNIQQYLYYADTHNMEGIMLNKDTYWQNKRNNGILKVKSFKSCDVKVLRVEAGSGKYEGTLGSIVCDYKGYELGVGSGFTDSQRQLYWEHPELIVGNIATVKYKVETSNKDGGLSVQFPVFQAVRNDKNEPSYN